MAFDLVFEEVLNLLIANNQRTRFLGQLSKSVELCRLEEKYI